MSTLLYIVRKRRFLKYKDHQATREQLKEWLDEGKIKPKDEIWDPLTNSWKYAKNCTELLIGKISIELPNALWIAYKSKRFRDFTAYKPVVCLTVNNMITTVGKAHYPSILEATGIRNDEDVIERKKELETLSYLCLIFSALVVLSAWSDLPLFLKTTEQQNRLRDSIWHHNYNIIRDVIKEQNRTVNVPTLIDHLIKDDNDLVVSAVNYLVKKHVLSKDRVPIFQRELEFLAYNLKRYLMPAIEQNLDR